MTLRRLAIGAAVLLVLGVLAGCSAPVVPVVPAVPAVPLLTYVLDECHPAPNAGLLVADPTYGMVLRYDKVDFGPPRAAKPVAWPTGYTGRRVAGQIEVVGPDGRVVATTGNHYELIGVGVKAGGVDALGACGAFPR